MSGGVARDGDQEGWSTGLFWIVSRGLVNWFILESIKRAGQLVHSGEYQEGWSTGSFWRVSRGKVNWFILDNIKRAGQLVHSG